MISQNTVVPKEVYNGDDRSKDVTAACANKTSTASTSIIASSDSANSAINTSTVTNTIAIAGLNASAITRDVNSVSDSKSAVDTENLSDKPVKGMKEKMKSLSLYQSFYLKERKKYLDQHSTDLPDATKVLKGKEFIEKVQELMHDNIIKHVEQQWKIVGGKFSSEFTEDTENLVSKPKKKKQKEKEVKKQHNDSKKDKLVTEDKSRLKEKNKSVELSKEKQKEKEVKKQHNDSKKDKLVTEDKSRLKEKNKSVELSKEKQKEKEVKKQHNDSKLVTEDKSRLKEINKSVELSKEKQKEKEVKKQHNDSKKDKLVTGDKSRLKEKNKSVELSKEKQKEKEVKKQHNDSKKDKLVTEDKSRLKEKNKSVEPSKEKQIGKRRNDIDSSEEVNNVRGSSKVTTGEKRRKTIDEKKNRNVGKIQSKSFIENSNETNRYLNEATSKSSRPVVCEMQIDNPVVSQTNLITPNTFNSQFNTQNPHYQQQKALEFYRMIDQMQRSQQKLKYQNLHPQQQSINAPAYFNQQQSLFSEGKKLHQHGPSNMIHVRQNIIPSNQSNGVNILTQYQPHKSMDYTHSHPAFLQQEFQRQNHTTTIRPNNLPPIIHNDSLAHKPVEDNLVNSNRSYLTNKANVTPQQAIHGEINLSLRVNDLQLQSNENSVHQSSGWC